MKVFKGWLKTKLKTKISTKQFQKDPTRQNRKSNEGGTYSLKEV